MTVELVSPSMTNRMLLLRGRSRGTCNGTQIIDLASQVPFYQNPKYPTSLSPSEKKEKG